MELMRDPGAIGHGDRIETGSLDVLQALPAFHPGVEAAVAKRPLAILDGAAVHHVVGESGRAACFATDCALTMLVFILHSSSG